MFKKIALLTALAAFTVNAWAATDPSSVTIKVYGVALSANVDCSDATVVGYTEAGTDYDFKANPSIFTGTVAAGTYKCVILYMNSVVNFKPLANDGNDCVAGTSYHINVCRSGNCDYTTASPNASNVLVYSASPTAATTASDATTGEKVLLFLSTGSAGTGGDTFKQPVAATPNFGLALTNALVVPEAGASGTFVVNFDGKVLDEGSACGLNPPVFGFR